MIEEMLVTRALNELKLLDARILRKIAESEMVGCSKTSVPNINGKETKESFIRRAKAGYSSITDLIHRRNAIKTALIQSNAVTMVEIAGKKMSVAGAIEKKESIKYEKELLRQLILQYEKACNKMHSENERVSENIEALLITAYGKEGKDKISGSSYDAIANPYRAANEYSLVEAMDTSGVIHKMQDEIESFESEVDICLQISNSTTSMKVEI